MNTLDWVGSIYITNESVGMDISEAVIRIEITEDLFSPYPMGYILIQDMPSNSIIAKMGQDGVVGKGEQIQLAFVAKIGQYFQELSGFHIYKVEPLAPDDPQLVRQKMNYKLYFSSQVFFTNELIRINQFWCKIKLWVVCL